MRGAWGVLDNIHIQEGEVERDLGVGVQNLDPQQGVMDQKVAGDRHHDGTG